MQLRPRGDGWLQVPERTGIHVTLLVVRVLDQRESLVSNSANSYQAPTIQWATGCAPLLLQLATPGSSPTTQLGARTILCLLPSMCPHILG